MNKRKSQFGVTLNELLISISVVVILLGLATPSFSDFLSKRKVAAAANMISAFLENVKMESIKRNEFATVSFQMEEDGDSWCIGAVMSRDDPCDCMAEVTECLIDSVPTTLSDQTYGEFNEVKADFIDGALTFDPIRGILLDPNGSMQMEISHDGEDYKVDVSINATGSVRKCTPAGFTLVGFTTCV